MQSRTATLSSDEKRVIAARHHDPFCVLGRHPKGAGICYRVHLPGAREVRLAEADAAMERVPGSDLFAWSGDAAELPAHPRVSWTDRHGTGHSAVEPYTFPPQLSDFDMYLFGEGNHHHAYQFLGAHPRRIDDIGGVLFAVWAPGAERVSVVGDFNEWDGRRHPMRVRGGNGIWELFIPGLKAGCIYKYEIRNREHGTVLLKADPYAQRFEQRPNTASVVSGSSGYAWRDGDWMRERAGADWQRRPMSVYEVHLGSWQRDAKGNFLSYRKLAERLVAHVLETGFTHIELLPVTEHPLDASWGYQTTGYYAVTSRFGKPDDFRAFVDLCHRNGIGVILDWAPAHFPKDAHGLARFDGSALYEHEDPRLGEHRDWGTLIFNYGRNEVKNFLISSAVYWLEELHLDGLRVDAVASMLYLDYSRNPGDWVPNRYGGNENLEAIEFLRELNTVTHEQQPGVLLIAEESTAWPQVTRPPWLGGLGFNMKWNMGWMHDTLRYMALDPVFRHYHHGELTFALVYAFAENYMLPFSHDEVVHGKAPLLGKMPGDPWQRFANLRLLYCFMWSHPGKKLLFMGCEFAAESEWDFDRALDWNLLESPRHAGMQRLVADLNRLYRELPALHRVDFSADGFAWIDCHDAAQSVLSFLRRDGDDFVVVILNFTPVVRRGYRIGVPEPGHYRERLNSDSAYYAGSNVGNAGLLETQAKPWMGHPCSLVLDLPPLGALILAPEPAAQDASKGASDAATETGATLETDPEADPDSR